MAATNSRWRWVALSVAFIASVVVGASAVIAVREVDEGTRVTLEALDNAGPDPFTGSVTTATPDQVSAFLMSYRAGSTTTLTSSSQPPDAAIGMPVSGDTPGLYGGSGDDAVCDAGALVEFLDAHEDKALAWAEAIGIPAGQIRSYVGGLEPVLLTVDTAVLNHGFSAGTATPRPAVLQAGTAVLVDSRGIPRVKCGCGNPLAEAPTPTGTITYAGDAWESFDAMSVVAVLPSTAELSSLQVSALDGSGQITVGVGEVDDAIRSVDFQNFTYTSAHPDQFEPCWVGSFNVVDGLADFSPDISEDLRRPVVDVYYGDLDGDGREDAVVHLACYAVADYLLDEFQLFSWDGATAVFRQEVAYLGGTSATFEKAFVEPGAFVVHARRDRSAEPFYNNVLPVELRVTWDGRQFETQETDRTSLAADRIVFGPTGFPGLISYDQPIEDVIAALETVLGPPTEAGEGCQGPYANWEDPDTGGGLHVDGHSAALLWISVDAAMIGDVALVTEAGVSVGATASDLRDAYPGRLLPPTDSGDNGLEYRIGDWTFAATTYDLSDPDPVMTRMHVAFPGSACE